MNRFGEIADELTDLIEELDHPDLGGEARALKAALQRAFNKACEAERVLRLKQNGEPEPVKRTAPAARRTRGPAPPEGSGVVIKLPVAWLRRRSANARP